MKRYGIEARYEVTEYIEVEADTIGQAEDKALEMLRLGVTGGNRNIVDDTSEEADIVRSEELAPPEGKQ